MTAEVALLNKGAVVLAADSAVTISVGTSQEKTFDTADKLFELSSVNHIGVIVNGDLDFMEAPLSVLIKRFRSTCEAGESVPAIAERFLEYLSEFGSDGPAPVREDSIRWTVDHPLREVKTRADRNFQERLPQEGFLERYKDIENVAEKVRVVRRDLLDEQLDVLTTWVSRFPDATFTGNGNLRVAPNDRKQIESVVDELMPELEGALRVKAVDLGKLALKKAGFGASTTGLIIAGYGENDLFPTLISFNIYGMVSGRLKYLRQETVDVDRSGTRARVVAFAQREMVERFLYGIDNEIERSISQFSREAVSQIRQSIFSKINLEGDGLAELEAAAERAESAFLNGLASEGFAAIRQQSQSEIEGMVEFMPKAEMARMAEALVNLTSIKRRVSKGMETVGGPIDVAVISQSEGFVWVKRKHYFPAELNSRFFERKRMETTRFGGEKDES